MNGLNEKKNNVKITHGMANIQKHAARKCPQCGLGIGTYPGRYPDKCPDCGTSLKPTVEEQIALVRRGVPGTDVKWLAECNVDLVEVRNRIDDGEDLLEILDKFKQAFKKGLSGIKQQAGEFKKAGTDLRKSKLKKTQKKIRALGKKKKKAKTPEEKARLKKKAQQKAKSAGKLQRTIKKREGGDKPKPKGGKLVTAGTRAKSAALKKKRAAGATPSKAAEKKKPAKKKTAKESIMIKWDRTPYRNQIEPIRRAIGEMIMRDGFARLDKIQETFKTNPVALRNIIRTHAEAWNVILTESDRRVYPRKHGDQING